MPTPPGVPAIVESHDPSYPIYIQNHAAGSNSRRAISPKACGFSLRVQTMMTGFYSLGVDASAHHHAHHQRPSQHAHQTKRIRHTRSVLSPLSYERRPQRALPSNYQRSELIWRKTELTVTFNICTWMCTLLAEYQNTLNYCPLFLDLVAVSAKTISLFVAMTFAGLQIHS